jgi:predicted ATPase
VWIIEQVGIAVFPQQLGLAGGDLLEDERAEEGGDLIIDEPELGLHPYVIKLLASLLHEAAQHAQLIVSTQATLLLDELTPEQVIVVNHREGETLFERQDSAKLQDWLKEYTLGQLWEKNELGGLP